MTGLFYTHVAEIGPSPLGLLPARWSVTHRCARCRRDVAAADLIAHTEEHGPDLLDQGDDDG